MRTKAPKTAGVFQIMNPADEGTQDSTNFCILTFEINSREATATFEKMVEKARAEASALTKHSAWQVFSRDAMQGKTVVLMGAGRFRMHRLLRNAVLISGEN